jgi:hypothetical protein
MNAIVNFLRRVFGRKPQPSPRYVYLSEAMLPVEADELVRRGAIEPWRTDGLGVRWFRTVADGEGRADD